MSETIVTIANLPPYIRARAILDILERNEKYEQSQQREAWEYAYAGTMVDSQAVFDALPLVTDKGQIPISAAQVGFDSSVQGVSHNVCHAVRRNPVLLGDPKVTALRQALDAFKGDDNYPEIIPTSPLYLFPVNPDLSVTLAAKPPKEES